MRGQAVQTYLNGHATFKDCHRAEIASVLWVDPSCQCPGLSALNALQLLPSTQRDGASVLLDGRYSFKKFGEGEIKVSGCVYGSGWAPLFHKNYNAAVYNEVGDNYYFLLCGNIWGEGGLLF